MPQDYNATINLPKTDFPMRAGLPKREPDFLASWDQGGNELYHQLMEKNEGKPMFVLHDGPPYANGNLHMGHALNKVLKDFIIRYKNMAGFKAPYIPGWDTHGLPIERQAIKAFGLDREKVSVVDFRHKCEEFARSHVDTQREQFRRLGIRLEQRGDDLYIPSQEHYEIETFMDGTILTLADAPWPGLTPDLLSVMLVVATQAKGTVLIHQKMFESRLFFVDRLIDMGAQIILCDPHRAVVVGHDHQKPLQAGRMTSPDIRAGIAMLIAALSAQGVSEISNIQQIDRGYQQIEQRLNALGAHILRV